jgi:hypothetical protein
MSCPAFKPLRRPLITRLVDPNLGLLGSPVRDGKIETVHLRNIQGGARPGRRGHVHHAAKLIALFLKGVASPPLTYSRFRAAS